MAIQGMASDAESHLSKKFQRSRSGGTQPLARSGASYNAVTQQSDVLARNGPPGLQPPQSTSFYPDPNLSSIHQEHREQQLTEHLEYLQMQNAGLAAACDAKVNESRFLTEAAIETMHERGMRLAAVAVDRERMFEHKFSSLFQEASDATARSEAAAKIEHDNLVAAARQRIREAENYAELQAANTARVNTQLRNTERIAEAEAAAAAKIRSEAQEALHAANQQKTIIETEAARIKAQSDAALIRQNDELSAMLQKLQLADSERHKSQQDLAARMEAHQLAMERRHAEERAKFEAHIRAIETKHNDERTALKKQAEVAVTETQNFYSIKSQNEEEAHLRKQDAMESRLREMHERFVSELRSAEMFNKKVDPVFNQSFTTRGTSSTNVQTSTMTQAAPSNAFYGTNMRMSAPPWSAAAAGGFEPPDDPGNRHPGKGNDDFMENGVPSKKKKKKKKKRKKGSSSSSSPTPSDSSESSGKYRKRKAAERAAQKAPPPAPPPASIPPQQSASSSQNRQEESTPVKKSKSKQKDDPPSSDPSSSSSSDDEGGGGNRRDKAVFKFMREVASFMSKDKKKSSKVYAKEADSVKLKPVPTPGMFYIWQQDLREEIVCASGRGDTAFKWALEIEAKETTFDSLADSGKFVSLDVKLGRAAREAASHNDSLSKLLQDKRNQIGVKEETIMKGRQAIFLIYQYYATTGIKKGLTSITVLMAVRLHRKRLQEFLSVWDRVLLHIDETPSDAILTRLFYDQVKNCELLKIDIATYHRMDEGDVNKSYAWLRKCVEGEIDRHRKTIMDDSLHDRMLGHQGS